MLERPRLIRLERGNSQGNSAFDGVEIPVAILSSYPRSDKALVTTRVGRVYSQERVNCLERYSCVGHDIRLHNYRIAKVHSQTEKSDVPLGTQSAELLDTRHHDEDPDYAIALEGIF